MRFSLAAVALDDHHALPLVAGNQAVADELLHGGDVLRVEPVSYTHLDVYKRQAESAALCPSDMMLCVISYWVIIWRDVYKRQSPS